MENIDTIHSRLTIKSLKRIVDRLSKKYDEDTQIIIKTGSNYDIDIDVYLDIDNDRIIFQI